MLKKTAMPFFFAIALCGVIFAVAQPSVAGELPVYGYKIVNIYPHDPDAFTQGLIFEDGFLYEGTGLYGRSELRKVEIKTGRVLKSHRLPERYFGEGITNWKDKIIQLTWKGKEGFGELGGERGNPSKCFVFFG